MASTIIGLVPWATLIEKAPDIFDGAVKLYRSLGKSRAGLPTTIDLVAVGTTELDSAKLAETVRALETALATLNAQMTDASNLIQQLAESNAALVRATSRHGRWLVASAVVSAVSLAVAGIALWH